MDSPAALGGIGCCICSTVIFLIVLISTSISKVETTEWALKYNWWAESVDATPLTKPGMTWVGMANYLVKFPNTNKNVYFRYGNADNFGGPDDLVSTPIEVRTNDGLSISLELEYTYRLQVQNLHKLYMLVGDEKWHTVLLYLSTGVLDNWAATFSASEFYRNRTLIQETFKTQLSQYMNEYLYMDLKTLQLQPAHFPTAYTNAIKMTQYYNTDIEVAVQEQKTVSIQKETELKVTKELAQRTKYEAEATASETLLSNSANVEQFKYRQTTEAQGYSQALQYLSSVDPANGITNFFNFMNVRALKEHKDAASTIRVPGVTSR